MADVKKSFVFFLLPGKIKSLGKISSLKPSHPLFTAGLKWVWNDYNYLEAGVLFSHWNHNTHTQHTHTSHNVVFVVCSRAENDNEAAFIKKCKNIIISASLQVVCLKRRAVVIKLDSVLARASHSTLFCNCSSTQHDVSYGTSLKIYCSVLSVRKTFPRPQETPYINICPDKLPLNHYHSKNNKVFSGSANSNTSSLSPKFSQTWAGIRTWLHRWVTVEKLLKLQSHTEGKLECNVEERFL